MKKRLPPAADLTTLAVHLARELGVEDRRLWVHSGLARCYMPQELRPSQQKHLRCCAEADSPTDR